jgi:hypothetical protein
MITPEVRQLTPSGMASPRFEVACVHCRRLVMFVRWVGIVEREQLRIHLLTCCPEEISGIFGLIGVEATLRHFSVAPTEPDEPPHDAA